MRGRRLSDKLSCDTTPDPFNALVGKGALLGLVVDVAGWKVVVRRLESKASGCGVD